jgi:hypothetical protein
MPKLYRQKMDEKKLDHQNTLTKEMVYIEDSGSWCANPLYFIYTLENGEKRCNAGCTDYDMNLYGIESQHADIFIECNTQSVHGHVILSMRCFKTSVSQVVFRLNNGLRVKSVHSNSTKLIVEQLDICSNGYRVTLDTPKAEGETINLEMVYGGQPLLSYPSFIKSERGLLWAETQLLPTLNFFPIDKYKLDLKIYLKPDKVFVCVGETMTKGEGGHLIHSKIPISGLSFAYGDYRYTNRHSDELEVNLYSEGLCDAEIHGVFERIFEILKFYLSIFQCLPYSKIHLCYDTRFEICSIHSNLIYLYRTDDVALSHELAHLWWGMSVSGNGPGWRWIHEGFADFFSELYMCHKDKKMEEKLKWIEKTSFDSLHPFDPINNYDTWFGMEDEMYAIYKERIEALVHKAGWKTFIRRIQKVLKEYSFNSITAHMLLKKLKEDNDGRL